MGRHLATVYDAENPWGRDDDFFLAAVDETPAARVLDLGAAPAASPWCWPLPATP